MFSACLTEERFGKPAERQRRKAKGPALEGELAASCTDAPSVETRFRQAGHFRAFAAAFDVSSSFLDKHLNLIGRFADFQGIVEVINLCGGSSSHRDFFMRKHE